ncbi:hypothetical protein C4G28_RS10615 [Vibrio parahaemolyticus]|nr:hypothetical protein [Vibrio parahaemolyticus]EJG0790071.1 hypothetical protein [Vibrio parahaemolyticus]
MGLFDFFRKNKTSNQDVTLDKPEVELDEIVEEFDNVDYLGKAASAGTKAKQAVKNKKYDKAWKLFHEQKECMQCMQIDLGLQLGKPWL